MDQHVQTLRRIADRAGVPPLRQVALLPGVRSVYRVTVHHDALNLADAIVTVRQTGTEAPLVEAVYPGYFGHKPLIRRLTLSEFEQFSMALSQLQFDRLSDQPGIPFYGSDIWLVERASGGFSKGVGLAGSNASGVYRQLLTVIQRYLPEVTREIS